MTTLFQKERRLRKNNAVRTCHIIILHLKLFSCILLVLLFFVSCSMSLELVYPLLFSSEYLDRLVSCYPHLREFFPSSRFRPFLFSSTPSVIIVMMMTSLFLVRVPYSGTLLSCDSCRIRAKSSKTRSALISRVICFRSRRWVARMACFFCSRSSFTPPIPPASAPGSRRANVKGTSACKSPPIAPM